MGVPAQIKTDNGPCFIAQWTQEFFQQWGVTHITGIPHSPTGQAIIERTHKVLKDFLEKQKMGELGEPPSNRLMKAIYVMNFLTLCGESVVPPVVRHFQTMNSGIQNIDNEWKVWVKNIECQQWEGPFKVIMWGRGYACVITENGPKWIPTKWTKPYAEIDMERADCSKQRDSDTGD